MDKIIRILVREFKIKEGQVRKTIELIDEGNTVPLLQDIVRK